MRIARRWCVFVFDQTSTYRAILILAVSLILVPTSNVFGQTEDSSFDISSAEDASTDALDTATHLVDSMRSVAAVLSDETGDRADEALATAIQTAGRRADRAAEEQLQSQYAPFGEPLDKRRKSSNIDGVPDGVGGDGLSPLIVPRVLLFPAYLATEYLVRWPIGKLLTATEKYHILERAYAATTFADGDAGIRPTFAIATDRASHFGAAFFYNDLADGGLDLHLGASGFPQRNTLARGRLDIELPDERSVLETWVKLESRDDYVYYGIGRQPSDRSEARYTEQTILGHLGWDAGRPNDPAGANLGVEIFRRRGRCSPQADLDACGDDSNFATEDDPYPVEADGVAPLGRDYDFARTRAHLFWDSRPADSPDGTGVRLEGFGGAGLGIGADHSYLGAVRYGSEVAAFWDIFDAYQRTLGLRLRAERADPVSNDRLVPVGELISLGGIETMRGFHEDRFRGRSAVVATLDYRYPVWSYFEGEIFIEAGNVFEPRFDDFNVGNMRGSFGLGLRSVEIKSRHLSIDLNLAFGTDRFENGFDIDSFQLNAGTNWGF